MQVSLHLALEIKFSLLILPFGYMLAEKNPSESHYPPAFTRDLSIVPLKEGKSCDSTQLGVLREALDIADHVGNSEPMEP